jgi:hypothetical protein
VLVVRLLPLAGLEKVAEGRVVDTELRAGEEARGGGFGNGEDK